MRITKKLSLVITGQIECSNSQKENTEFLLEETNVKEYFVLQSLRRKLDNFEYTIVYVTSLSLNNNYDTFNNYLITETIPWTIIGSSEKIKMVCNVKMENLIIGPYLLGLTDKVFGTIIVKEPLVMELNNEPTEIKLLVSNQFHEKYKNRINKFIPFNLICNQGDNVLSLKVNLMVDLKNKNSFISICDDDDDAQIEHIVTVTTGNILLPIELY